MCTKNTQKTIFRLTVVFLGDASVKYGQDVLLLVNMAGKLNKKIRMPWVQEQDVLYYENCTHRN